MRWPVEFNLKKENFLLKVETDLVLNQVLAIWGASGSGKTLLLRCLMGLEPSLIGRIPPPDRFLEKNASSEVRDNSQEKRSWRRSANQDEAWRSHLAYVSQEAYLFPHLSVADNLTFARQRAVNPPLLPESDIIAALSIQPLLNQLPASLSGGQRQRVAIAQSLLVAPKILLLDEPLSAIDGNSRQKILAFLQSLRGLSQLKMIYVTHRFEEVLLLADQILLLENGSVTANGALETVLAGSSEKEKNSRAALPQEQLCRLVATTIRKIDNEEGLVTLTFSGGELLKSQQVDEALGDRVDVFIYAEDVSLALHPNKETTILNCLPATITDKQFFAKGKLLVTLTLGDAQLFSLVTPSSYRRLGLAVGQEVYAQFKALSLARRPVDA